MSYKDDLEKQIRDQYGKVVYSYACHWEEIGLLVSLKKLVKNGEIALTAITTTGIVGYLISESKVSVIISAIFSALALGLTLYARENNIEEKIVKHQKTADDLWIIREKYLSLLTDFSVLDETSVRGKRDVLSEQLSAIYKCALPTSKKAYEKAQKQIKENEYQFFSTEELKNIFPEHLRK